MDARIYRLINDNFTYDEFRSELMHYLKYNTVKDYVSNILRFDMIETLWNKNEYAKALYLLALFDYYSFLYKADSSLYFSQYRKMALSDHLFPTTLDNAHQIALLNKCKADVFSRYFLRHNIVEYWPDDLKHELHA